ncbi:hypothetical protein ACWERJ_36970, partial [Streptomyces sp. NPDC004050]
MSSAGSTGFNAQAAAEQLAAFTTEASADASADTPAGTSGGAPADASADPPGAAAKRGRRGGRGLLGGQTAA